MRKLVVLMAILLCVVALAGEVNIWSWRSQDAEVWKQVEQELRKMGKDIKINFTAFAPTEYDAKIAV
ncbi:MAG: ABC transporter substrate-binding protein, partial [Pseudothermotoga sp.]|nr:ABC transporter substrate-binding protein [Pseudothermotoga sp.]